MQRNKKKKPYEKPNLVKTVDLVELENEVTGGQQAPQPPRIEPPGPAPMPKDR